MLVIIVCSSRLLIVLMVICVDDCSNRITMVAIDMVNTLAARARGEMDRYRYIWYLPFGGIGDASTVPFVLMIRSNADLFRLVLSVKVKITPISNQFIILLKKSHHCMKTLRDSSCAPPPHFSRDQQLCGRACAWQYWGRPKQSTRMRRNTRNINFVMISIHTSKTT